MPAYPIDDDYLNRLCYHLSQENYIYYQVSQAYRQDLYNTGCRPMELLQPDRWSITGANEATMQPLKGNNPRTIQKTLLSDELLFAIDNQVPPYQGLSLRQLSSVTKKIIPVLMPSAGSKSAIDYIFRYNYVKRLHNAGASDAAIQAKMGWISALLPASYYTQSIQAFSPLPPLPPVMKYPYRLYGTGGLVFPSGTSPELFTTITIPGNTLEQDGDSFTFTMIGEYQSDQPNISLTFGGWQFTIPIDESGDVYTLTISLEAIRRTSTLAHGTLTVAPSERPRFSFTVQFPSLNLTTANDLTCSFIDSPAQSINVYSRTVDIYPLM